MCSYGNGLTIWEKIVMEFRKNVGKYFMALIFNNLINLLWNYTQLYSNILKYSHKNFINNTHTHIYIYIGL